MEYSTDNIDEIFFRQSTENIDGISVDNIDVTVYRE